MKFKDSIILITGGTGSCGRRLTRHFLAQGAKEIRILSRDEKKHYDLILEMQGEKRIRSIIGDVRDPRRILEASNGVDLIIHTAAMKHVTIAEPNPYEAIKTNIIGTNNVIEAALANKVARMVSLSTDKAVEPVNVMGMTKALSERLIIAANTSPSNEGTLLSCVRYGNVMNSRGSAIPFFRHCLRNNSPLTITHKNMTRFMLTLGDAVDLVSFAAANMKGGEVFVRKAPSVLILDLAAILCEMEKKPFKPTFIGTFPGEKIHEVLISESEMDRAEEHELYWAIRPASIDSPKTRKGIAYSSHESLIPKKDIPKLIHRADAETADFIPPSLPSREST